MKRLLCMILALLLLLMAVGCNEKKQQVEGSQLVAVRYLDPIDDNPLVKQFFNASLNPEISPYWENGMAHQHIFRFDTVEELTTFNETYREILDESTPPNRSPATVTEATADMDQAFFEKNALLAVYVISGSISYSFYVEKIEKANGTLTVYIVQEPVPKGDHVLWAMAGEMALVPIEKSELEGIKSIDAILTK